MLYRNLETNVGIGTSGGRLLSWSKVESRSQVLATLFGCGSNADMLSALLALDCKTLSFRALQSTRRT